jgi:hypothetical protein
VRSGGRLRRIVALLGQSGRLTEEESYSFSWMAGLTSQKRAQRNYDQWCAASITRKMQFIYNFGCSKVNRQRRVRNGVETWVSAEKSGAGRRRLGQPCDEGAALRSALPIKKACRTGSVHSQHKLIAAARSIPQKLQTGYNFWRKSYVP